MALSTLGQWDGVSEDMIWLFNETAPLTLLLVGEEQREVYHGSISAISVEPIKT